MNLASLLAELTERERELQSLSTRGDAARLAELLHPDFFEIGRSGQIFHREGILAILPSQQEPRPIHSRGFTVRLLAEDLAQLTYQSARLCHDGTLEHHSIRSSLWKRASDGWRIVFHQGTPSRPFD